MFIVTLFLLSLFHSDGVGAVHKSKTENSSPSRAASPSDTRDIAIHNSAQKNENKLITKDIPATDGGNLACAWAVNYVVKDAIGRDVSGDVPDGLTSTAVMYDTLVGGRGADVAIANAPPGSIVISPTRWVNGSRNTGHVGILGKGTGDERPIYSNSSRHARWEKNHTVGKWIAYYGGKGLQVKVYRFTP